MQAEQCVCEKCKAAYMAAIRKNIKSATKLLTYRGKADLFTVPGTAPHIERLKGALGK